MSCRKSSLLGSDWKFSCVFYTFQVISLVRLSKYKISSFSAYAVSPTSLFTFLVQLDYNVFTPFGLESRKIQVLGEPPWWGVRPKFGFLRLLWLVPHFRSRLRWSAQRNTVGDNSILSMLSLSPPAWFTSAGYQSRTEVMNYQKWCFYSTDLQ